MKNLHTRKTSNGSNFGWLIRQMSINQKSGRQTFRRRFVSGSLFISPCPPECNFQSETKIEPDLRLHSVRVLTETWPSETEYHFFFKQIWRRMQTCGRTMRFCSVLGFHTSKYQEKVFMNFVNGIFGHQEA